MESFANRAGSWVDLTTCSPLQRRNWRITADRHEFVRRHHSTPSLIRRSGISRVRARAQAAMRPVGAGRLARSCDASRSFARGCKAAGGPNHPAKPPVRASIGTGGGIAGALDR
jgi:hypothetical protein